MLEIVLLLVIVSMLIGAGYPLCALLLPDDQTDHFWVWVPLIGTPAWICGTNLGFFLSGNFTLVMVALLLLFAGLAVLGYRRRRIPPISKTAIAVLGVAAGLWLIYLIPVFFIGAEDYIGLFGGDGQNYARTADYFLEYTAREPFALGSGLRGIAQLACNDRAGASLLMAAVSWPLGVSGRASLYPLTLLGVPLLMLGAFLTSSRLRLPAVVVWAMLLVIGTSSLFLFLAYTTYSGKALGLPLLLVSLLLGFDGLTEQPGYRRLALAALVSAALAVTYYEVAPIWIFFFIGVMATAGTWSSLRGVLNRWCLIALGAFLLAPNLLRIISWGVIERLQATTSAKTGYWDRILVKPFLSLLSGLNDDFTINTSGNTVTYRWPREILWSQWSAALAPGAWVSRHGVNSEYYFLSWMLFLAVAVTFFIGLVGASGAGRFRKCVLVFPLAGCCLLCLAGMSSKSTFNLLIYLGPFWYLVLAQGAGMLATEIRQRRLVVASLILAPVLLYALAVPYRGLNLAFSTMSRARPENAVYYERWRAAKDLIGFLETNAAADTKIVFLDDMTSVLEKPWNPLKYWLYYELRAYDVRFTAPGVHFPGQTSAAVGTDRAALYVYAAAVPSLTERLERTADVLYAKAGFMVFNDLAAAEAATVNLPRQAPRDLVIKPPLITGDALAGFAFTNGHYLRANEAVLASLEDLTDYSLELWLKADEVEDAKGRFDDRFPQMPGILGPMAIYQFSRWHLRVVIGGNTGLIYDLRTDLYDRWTHLALTVRKNAVALFVDGQQVAEATNMVLLFRGSLILGRGYLQRTWSGEIAGLRICSPARDLESFTPDPEVASVTGTVFLWTGDKGLGDFLQLPATQ